jgi:3-hydroxyacyl-CoA dehydrogenase
MIEEYVSDAMDRVRCVTSLQEIRGASIIFEAIIEDIEVKGKVLREADQITGHRAYFFSNTSSIPIRVLQEKSGVANRLIGFHFYNPPAIQKLLELIIAPNTDPKLCAIAFEIAQKLKKTVVQSGDVAGFIGNGHFLREIAFASGVVEEFSRTMPLIDAIQLVNRVTQEYLVRPMGIFQLLDYVGIDVCNHIGRVITEFLPEVNLSVPLVEKMVSEGVLGGQYPDGSQKPGFFRYQKGRPVEIYDLNLKEYVPCVEAAEGVAMPEGFTPWKVLSRDSGRSEKLHRYFASLMKAQGKEVDLARRFMEESRKIGRGLVSDGIAKNIDDVNTVLQQGFFHLYGVEDPFLQPTATGDQ